MERIAIISDVHGNITALNTVLKDIKEKNINRIFCLGDSIGKCSNPDLVIDRLRETCEVILLGNTDFAICNPETKYKNFWSRNKLGEERSQFVANLPVSFEFYFSGRLIRLFHASPFSLEHIYNPMFSNAETNYSNVEIKNAEDLFQNTEFLNKSSNDKIPDIIGYGHTHTPCIVRYKNKTLFNPGSVGIPIEMLNDDLECECNKFSTLTSYIIIEGNYNSVELSPISFTLVRLPYDINKEISYLANSDMPGKEKIIKSLKTSIS